MQKSNRTLSFGPSTEHTKVTREVRSRPRSSLDTFVISGRTRLPSSRTSILTDSSQDATNIQIAQTLLDRGARPRSRQPPISAVPRNSLGGSREFAQRSPISRSGSGRHTMAHPTTPRRIKRQGVFMGTPTNHNYDVISISPRRRTEAPAPQATPHHSVTDLAEDPFQDQTDGPNDTAGSRQVSRMASMSWSSISQRNISNSSASTQASRASDYRHDYNVLAEDHGLPLLSSDLSGTFVSLFR